jgi:gliding motility-associated-like protein
MLDANLSNPTVFPSLTTLYYVDLEIDGCTNRDSVLVRVVDHVNLQVMNDTTICVGDTIQLRTVSDGLRFAWTPASQLNNASVPNPIAVTPATTPYQVTATIGGCHTAGSITVTTVPYPIVDAGAPDTSICYNTSAPLQGYTNANSWTWEPASSLNNARLLNPIAYPTRTTTYTLTGRDTRSGCPKPSRDSIKVIVLPKIHASAGRDTSVIVGQPLQLHATGGDKYVWSPAANLSSINIPDPILLSKEASTGLRYQVTVYNAAGCVDSASINVKVFATGPAVFVPTAFTPNNDGLNDYLRPVAVGMQHIEYFNIYNRWGQLVYSSTINGLGWDGRISGQQQASNTYVWMVKAIDYLGKPYFLKGMVTLVR